MAHQCQEGRWWHSQGAKRGRAGAACVNPLPSREDAKAEGEGALSGSVRTGGPLTLTAVLFAIVRAHPVAVMPAVSLDTA